MALTTRALRQFGNGDFQNRLENFGMDRFGGSGDQVAVFRAGLHGLGSDAPHASTAATLSATAPTLALEGGVVSGVSAHASHASSVVGSGGVGSLMTEAALTAAGLSGQSIHYEKMQLGLADIYVAAQIAAANAGPAGRLAALHDFTVNSQYLTIEQGYVAIDAAAADGNGAALLAQLQALGLQNGAAFGASVSGYVPLDALDEMAALDALKFARPAYVDFNVGSVLSQDVAALHGDYIQQSHGLTGAGVSIGIMSDSFNTATKNTNGTTLNIHYSNDVTSLDLPAGITIIQDGTTANFDEGRAMAQLIYDMAPGVAMTFATANGGQANMAANILALSAAANIVVDDVRYLAEPMFSDGIVAKAVDQAVATGDMYFSSAGNYASSSYESAFRSSGVTITTTGLFTSQSATWLLHDFDPGAGVDIGQHITIGGSSTASASLVMQWDQPFFSVTGSVGATSDLAFFIWYDDNLNNTVDAGEVFDLNNTGTQIGGDPVESFSDFQEDGQLMIGVKVQGSVPATALPGNVKYVTFGTTVNQLEWATASGTNYGHSNAAGAISVGAADWFNTPSVGQTILAEPFSSRGNVPIWVDAAGNHLQAPIYRDKTEFTSADGGNTTFFSSDASSDADSFGNFYGTSAAAPNAAAIAVLLKQRFPSATGAQIEQAMKLSALDITNLATTFPTHTVGAATGVGYDPITGWGLVQADRALTALEQLLNAATQLGTGSVAIVSYESDVSAGGSPDGMRFVLLGDVQAGTTIYFSDRAWNGTSFALASAGEGTYTFVAGSNLVAGTIVTVSAAQLTAAGITLSTAGETIYAYQGGQDNPTKFLFAIDLADGNTTFNGTLTGTGLTAGVNAVAVAFDNASYAGSATQIAQTQLVDISNNTHWHGSDTDDTVGTPNYTEVIDTTVTNAFANPDMVMIAGMAGGGQSDAILRIGNDEGANVGSGLARLFRDNPAFNHLSDISFDLENGFFFAVDSDFTGVNRIIRGNVADLVSGISNPTFTQIFATDNQNNGTGAVIPGEGISSLEINTVSNKIYWIDGDITGTYEGGWQVWEANYDGTGMRLIQTLDTENPDPSAFFGPGGVADYALYTGGGNNFLYVVNSTGVIDGIGNATIGNNHILRVNVATGATTVLLLGAADPRSGTGGGTYADGRLIPAEGQIIAIDVDQTTGIIYFVTQPISANDHGGIFSYNPTTDTLVELWEQPTNNAFNTLQSFPTSNLTAIEVDEIGHRIYVSATSDSDSEFDGSPATNEDDAAIFSLAIGAAVGTAPTLFQRVVEPTANGAPQGMEIDYAPVTGATGANATYTESTNNPGSPAGPVVAPVTAVSVTDADNTVIQGATIAITNGFFAGDQLSVTVGGSGIVATVNNTLGYITLTGAATLAQYQTVLASVRYTNAGDNPTNYGSNTTRTISFTTFDGLANSDPATATLTVVGINDAPVNTIGGTVAATEDTGIVLTGMSVADPDADPALQDITVTLSVTHGTITVFTNAAGGVIAADVTGNGTGTVTITATQNEINATLAAANGVTYQANLDFNGNDTLTMTTNDLGRTGNDPGLTGNGTSEQDQDTRSITIAAVNDAPVVSGDGTEDSATIFEDQPSAVGQTINALFAGQYSDQKDNQIPNGGASSPGAFSGVAVTANNSSAATGQWQYFNGTIWVDIGTVSDAAAKLFTNTTAIRFNPALNYNGPEPTLVVHLIDNSLGFGITNAQVVNISAAGSTGGTTAYSTGTVTLGGTITPVNDAPTSTNLTGDIATWTEGGAAVLLDVGSNLTIADVDSLNFDTGTLTVHIGAGLVAAQDQLGISSTGGVTSTATTVSVGGIQIATYTGGGAGGGDLVFTLDPDATPAAVQALMRAITFNNTGGDNPTAGARTITWTLVDGDGTANGGADTMTVNSSVNVVSVNDAPAGADHSAALNEDATYTFANADFGFTDVDGNTLLAVKITTLPTAGTIFLDTDGAGGAAPVAVTLGQSILASEIAAGHLTYVPVANANGTPYATFTFQVQDNGGTANGGVDLDPSANTFTFNVASVNDAPTSTNLTGDIATWTEGNSAVALDVGGNATIADIDSLNFDTGTLTVAITSGLVAGQDQLTIITSGTVTVAGNAVSVGGTQIATFTGGGAGGAPLVFTLDPDATPASVATLIHAIGYNNSGGASPTAGVRGITWTLVDGDGTANGGADTLTTGSVVNVISINDAPAGTDNAFTINEDATYTFATSNFGFTDLNNDGFLAVKITTLPVDGKIFYDADGAGGAAPVAVIAGQSILVSEIALGKLTFVPDLDENGTPYTTFTFQVQDNGGTAAGGIDLDPTPNTITFNVTAVNDAPVNTVPGTQSINEDANFTLSTGNGNAISVADVDAGTLTVTLTVVHGTLTLASIAGLSFGTGDGTGDATMTFTGTAAAINAALGAGVTYNPTANYHGSDAISVVTTDGGQTGTGPIGTDSDSISINIASVNDAPSGADHTVSGSEDDPYVFTAADFGFTDPNDGNAFNAISVMTFPGNGKLYLDVDGPGGAAPVDLSTIGAGAFVGIADINAGHLYFQPDPDEFGDNYASFTFKVQDDGGIANGGVDLDPTANTITINVVPDNLPPAVDLDSGVAGINADVNYTEDDPGIAIGTGITVTDPDSGLGDKIESATITLTDKVAGDSLSFNGLPPVGFLVVTNVTASTIVMTITGTGTQAEYDSLLAQVRYSSTNQDPTIGGTDTERTIQVTVNDGNVDSAVATSTVHITAVDDQAQAGDDSFTTDEASAIVSGNLFGNDSDPDGPPISVAAVNGAAVVGSQIQLDSGALLTVNADGTFDYDPNGYFDPTPTLLSGASNQPDHDSFTYTLTNGTTATVTITINGLDTDDLLLGTAGVDHLEGGAGNDTIDGLGGLDTLLGGTGDDFIFVNAGDVVVELAGEGFDNVAARASYTLAAGAEIEVLSTDDHAGTAAINLTGNEYDQVIIGNAGANILDGGTGNDHLAGMGGDDTIYVDAGDTVDEQVGGGHDNVVARTSYVLNGGAEVEVLSTTDNAGTSNINLTGNEYAQLVLGNAGSNILSGGSGGDTLNGLAGNDFIFANFNDTVAEGVGNGYDNVWANESFTLQAGAEIEVLSTSNHAGTSAINLTGNEFGQVVIGNAGNNILDGGLGNDRLAGFGGNDIFSFSTALGPNNQDVIADFNAGDRIRLDHNVFSQIGLGMLTSGAFVAGTAALDGNDRIIYDSATGHLFYDADGTGAGAQVLVATLENHAALSATDLFVV